MRYLVVAAAVASIAFFAFAGAGLADPPGLLIPAPPHQHFVVTPTGEMIAVGPQICENPNLELAFTEFHFNIHHSALPGVGAIPTLGPQGGAPGLHNGLGAELTVVPGCA